MVLYICNLLGVVCVHKALVLLTQTQAIGLHALLVASLRRSLYSYMCLLLIP